MQRQMTRASIPAPAADPTRPADKTPIIPRSMINMQRPNAIHQITSIVMATPLPILKPEVEGRVLFFLELIPEPYVIHAAILKSMRRGCKKL